MNTYSRLYRSMCSLNYAIPYCSPKMNRSLGVKRFGENINKLSFLEIYSRAIAWCLNKLINEVQSNINMFGPKYFTGFLEIMITLILSQYNVMMSWPILLSCDICFNQSSWVQHKPAMIYSVSAVDNDTTLCFLLCMLRDCFQDRSIYRICSFCPQYYLPNRHMNNPQYLC